VTRPANENSAYTALNPVVYTVRGDATSMIPKMMDMKKNTPVKYNPNDDNCHTQIQ
jgi:hypothetical protein